MYCPALRIYIEGLFIRGRDLAVSTSTLSMGLTVNSPQKAKIDCEKNDDTNHCSSQSV